MNTHKLTHSHNTTQEKWNTKKESHILKMQIWRGEGYIFCFEVDINAQLTYFSCLFYGYIGWQIFLIRRVTEQQMCKIVKWKHLNRCTSFILHEMNRNVESTFWTVLTFGRLWIGVVLDTFYGLMWRIQERHFSLHIPKYCEAWQFVVN